MDIDFEQLQEMYPDFTDDQLEELYNRMHGEIPDKAPLSYGETAPMGPAIPSAPSSNGSPKESVSPMDLLPKGNQSQEGTKSAAQEPIPPPPSPDAFNDPNSVKGDESKGQTPDFRQMAIDSVIEKYGLKKYSPEERSRLFEQTQNEQAPPYIAAGLAAFGAGLAGRDPMRAAMSIRDRDAAKSQSRLTAFDKSREQILQDINTHKTIGDNAEAQRKYAKENDLNSPESQIAQSLAIKAGVSPDTAKKMTAAQFKNYSPAFLKMYEQAQATERAKIQANTTYENKNKTMAATKEEKAKLSDKQVESVGDFDQSIQKAEDMLKELGENSHWVGPVDAAVPDDLIGSDQVAFRAKVGRFSDAYRKLITGAGASNQELAKLEKRLPKLSDSWGNFKSKTQDFIREVKKEKEIYLENLKRQGKKVDNFKDPNSGSNQDLLELIRKKAEDGDQDAIDYLNSIQEH